MESKILDVRADLEKIRKVHTGHSRAMAQADIMRAGSGRLDALAGSLAKLEGPWGDFGAAEIARRAAL